MQSHAGNISVLPALPAVRTSGKVSGFTKGQWVDCSHDETHKPFW